MAVCRASAVHLRALIPLCPLYYSCFSPPRCLLCPLGRRPLPSAPKRQPSLLRQEGVQGIPAVLHWLIQAELRDRSSDGDAERSRPQGCHVVHLRYRLEHFTTSIVYSQVTKFFEEMGSRDGDLGHFWIVIFSLVAVTTRSMPLG